MKRGRTRGKELSLPVELYQLEYFRVLCKYGSYTDASQELSVSQPAISMAVKKLEDECGGSILDRRSKSFALTRKGEALLSWAVTVHNDVEGLLREMNSFSGRQREIIRLAFPMPLCPELMTEVIPAFSCRHSDVALHLLQEGHAGIVADLMSRTVDIGIICGDMLNPFLRSRPYKRLEYKACFSAEHRFNGADYITPDMLKDEQLLIPKAENSISKAIFSYFEPYSFNPAFSFTDIFPEDIWQLAERGEGVAFMPRHDRREHCAPLSPPLYSSLVVAWRAKETLTRKKKELIDFICGDYQRNE